jgi:fatty-acid peroxygenase
MNSIRHDPNLRIRATLASPHMRARRRGLTPAAERAHSLHATQRIRGRGGRAWLAIRNRDSWSSTVTPAIPRDGALDSSLAVLREGYTFISTRCLRFGSDLFAARLLGKRAICIHGREAVQLFYGEPKLQRRKAIPRRVITSLFGKGGVQALDGDEHRKRKAAFLSLMSAESTARLMQLTADEWRTAIRRWQSGGDVVLLDEAQRVLAAATCAWAGVPVAPHDVHRRAHDFAAMVDAFGGVGPRLWRGKLARARTERWLASVIEEVRSGRSPAEPGTALDVMANARDLSGQPLAARTAAVELINVIRPTVAISWYVAFAAIALHEHPGERERIAREQTRDDSAGACADAFMHEVRRFYPFTPFLGAKVSAPFTWKGCRFEPGTLVLLDVYGTDHDARCWTDPEHFRPDRFIDAGYAPSAFIPQGGGDRATGHRCPGEWTTMHNLALALHFLTRCMTYELAPGQDLRVSLRRMPARPASGVVIRQVRATERLDAAAPSLPSSTATRESAAATAPAPRTVGADVGRPFRSSTGHPSGGTL